MGAISRPIGDTNSGTNDWADVAGEDKAILDGLNAVLDGSNKLNGAQLATGTVPNAALTDGSITNAKLAGSITTANLAGSITDAKLSSPNNSVYKTLVSVSLATSSSWSNAGLSSTGAMTVNTHHLIAKDQTAPAATWTSAPNWGSANPLPAVFRYVGTEYSVGSLTTKFRVAMAVAVGSTSPSTVTLQGGLYPMTLVSGSWTPGTVVTGSTTTGPSPVLATNTVSYYTSSDFSASALLTDPGLYNFGVVVGSITVPAGITISLALQTRNV